jgi:hypothetical protein
MRKPAEVACRQYGIRKLFRAGRHSGIENLGRPGQKKGTRELVEWPYIIVYKVDEDRVVVGARCMDQLATLNLRRIS